MTNFARFVSRYTHKCVWRWKSATHKIRRDGTASQDAHYEYQPITRYIYIPILQPATHIFLKLRVICAYPSSVLLVSSSAEYARRVPITRHAHAKQLHFILVLRVSRMNSAQYCGSFSPRINLYPQSYNPPVLSGLSGLVKKRKKSDNTKAHEREIGWKGNA